MKIKNLLENIDKNEITEILQACNYKKSFSIDNDLNIVLKHDFLLDTNLTLYTHSKNLTTLPLKIKKAERFTVRYASMSDYYFLPVESKSISLERIAFYMQILDFKIDKTDSLILSGLSECAVYKCDTDNAKISYVSVVNCDDVHTLIFDKCIIDDMLRISYCKKITLSKDNFKIPPFVPNIELNKMYGITCFDADNNINVDNLEINGFYNLESWRHVQMFKVNKKMIISDIQQTNNIINIMFINDCIITIDNNLIDFSNYKNLTNRSQYIMDFAIDLLDSELENAAEL